MMAITTNNSISVKPRLRNDTRTMAVLHKIGMTATPSEGSNDAATGQAPCQRHRRYGKTGVENIGHDRFPDTFRSIRTKTGKAQRGTELHLHSESHINRAALDR